VTKTILCAPTAQHRLHDHLLVVDPHYARQERELDRRVEANARRYTERVNADIEKMLADLANDGVVPAAEAAVDDELPPLWQGRHDLLETYMRGTGRTQAGLRSTGKAPICYVLVGWLLAEWKREHRKEAGPTEIARTIGIRRSPAQNLLDQVRGFLAPGGLWNPSVSRKKRSAVSGKRAHKGTNPNAAASCADGDFLHDFWRSGGVEAIDRRLTSVVGTYRRYIPLGRKRPPATLKRSPSNRPSQPPRESFDELHPALQVILAYGAMSKREGLEINGLTYGCYDLTGKIHARAETRIRSKGIWAAYVRKRCVAEINKACKREKAAKSPFDLIINLEEDSRGQLHVHGALCCPVAHKELFETAIDVALGKWRHDGKNQRGHKPVLLRRAVTVRALGYAVKPESYVAGCDKPQVAMTGDLRRRAGEFYREAVAQVLDYRATGNRLITTTTKTPAHREGDRQFWRKAARYRKQMHDGLDPEFEELWRQAELDCQKKLKAAGAPAPAGAPMSVSTVTSSDMAAAINAEIRAPH